MATIRPFRGIRPDQEYAGRIAALPYDVYSREEAMEEVKREPMSFLRIDRPETNFAPDQDMYAPCVYEKAGSLLREWLNAGWLVKEESAVYYLYELTMNERVQTGIVAVASVDDYNSRVIKKHENTRSEKELDRIRHVKGCEAQTGPIFLAYRDVERINEITRDCLSGTPLYDFVSEDGIRHRVFKVDRREDIEEIENCFSHIDEIYIADGHHRCASAVKVCMEKREEAGESTGKEGYNSFLSVLFPQSQLQIMDYNRVVRDLNGMTEQEFLGRMEASFNLVKLKNRPVLKRKGEWGMFLNKDWYLLTLKEGIRIPTDPVQALDVSILQEHCLRPILGIEDPRTDQRIDFIGGIRGTEELERRVQKDCKVAFYLYPTSMEELFNVADQGLLMPPKSTWFEPKLRSGLFIHEL